MLLNISNHSSENWSDKQLEATKAFGGGVEDMPFPMISAVASCSDIITLSVMYANDIVKRYNSDADTIHVMGEMTFTYALVKRLREAGFRCVASTTERVKLQLPDGSFISEFRFQSFRDYE